MKYEYVKNRIVRVNDTSDLEKLVLTPFLPKPGFYIFPEDSRVAVSKNGDIFNIATGNMLIGHTHQSGSIHFHIYGNGLPVGLYRKHRIIARTFIGRPSRHLDKDFSVLSVNHVDGNRLNNTLDNLEWITNKENTKHASALGLMPNNKSVIALNIFSKKELFFISVKECAEEFGIHRATLYKHLNSGNSGKLHKNGFIFKYEDAEDFTIYPISQMKEIADSNRFKSVVVRNIKDGSHSIFPTMKEAAKYINISYASLFRRLTKYSEFIHNELNISFL